MLGLRLKHFLLRLALAAILLRSNLTVAADFRYPESDPQASDIAGMLKAGAKSIKGLDSTSLIITLGSQAFADALKDDNEKPILATYIWSNEYQAAIRKSVSNTHKTTAIFLDPDPVLQLRLARRLMADSERIGILLSREDQKSESLTEKRLSLPSTVPIESFINRTDLFRALGKLSDRNQAIIITPNKDLLNKETAMAMIDTSIERRRILIGFTQAYVTAGAAASVFSETAQINKQITETAGFIVDSHSLPEPSFPKYFRVAINRTVLHWFNLTTTDNEEVLASQILKSEVKH